MLGSTKPARISSNEYSISSLVSSTELVPSSKSGCLIGAGVVDVCMGAETVEGAVECDECITSGVQFSSPAVAVIFDGVLSICWDVGCFEIIGCTLSLTMKFSMSYKSSFSLADAEEMGERGLRSTANSDSRPLNVKFLSKTLVTTNNERKIQDIYYCSNMKNIHNL